MHDYPRRLLPPLAALEGFSLAVQLCSFSLAARELGLTQGAVSRQVALLESWLGLSLFERVGRTVRPTEQARDYAAALRPALQDIRRATQRAIERPSATDLTIATLPSFGMRWLAPRLPALTALNPDIVVSFSARTQRFDLRSEPFDAAVHFGKPDWPLMEHDLLFSEQVIPVAAPSLLRQRTSSVPGDLAGLPLLALASRQQAWQAWFAKAGEPTRARQPAAIFEQFLMLAQAAVSGAGAALIPSFLIEEELRSGALVQVCDLTPDTDGDYYLVYSAESLANEAFRRFRDWLCNEARSFASGAPLGR